MDSATSIRRASSAATVATLVGDEVNRLQRVSIALRRLGDEPALDRATDLVQAAITILEPIAGVANV